MCKTGNMFTRFCSMMGLLKNKDTNHSRCLQCDGLEKGAFRICSKQVGEFWDEGLPALAIGNKKEILPPMDNFDIGFINGLHEVTVVERAPNKVCLRGWMWSRERHRRSGIEHMVGGKGRWRHETWRWRRGWTVQQQRPKRLWMTGSGITEVDHRSANISRSCLLGQIQLSVPTVASLKRQTTHARSVVLDTITCTSQTQSLVITPTAFERSTQSRHACHQPSCWRAIFYIWLRSYALASCSSAPKVVKWRMNLPTYSVYQTCMSSVCCRRTL